MAARPNSDNNNSGAALRLVLAVEGDLTPRADVDGQASLTLVERDGGAEALRYEKLKVWDACGTEFVGRLHSASGGGEVWLEVEEAKATYPIKIDLTFVQQQKLTAGG